MSGEGCSDFQRIRMGEGLKQRSVPLTHQNLLRHFHALSREARGRISRRPVLMQKDYCADAGVNLGAVFCVACFGAASCLGTAACWAGGDTLAIWLSDILDSSSASAEAGSIRPQPN